MTAVEGWETKILRDLADIHISNVDKKVHASEMPVKLCNYMDVYSNEYITNRIQFMDASASIAEVERFSLNFGDVIITKDSETPDDIGIPTVVSEKIDDLVCGYHLALIRPNPDQLDSVYLAKQLSTSQVARYFAIRASGSTRYGLPISAIETVEIPTPPKPEQTKIAEILSTVDQAIEQTEALIAKQQRIKTGLMQDILTRGIDEHGNLRSEETHEFKDSPLGRIPTEWDTIDFGDVGEWYSGGTPSKANNRFWNGGVPWVCPKDMKQFELFSSIDTITKYAVETGTKLMPVATVFIVVRGMILAHTFPVGYAIRKVAFNQDVKAIVTKERINGRYLAYWLVSHSHEFLKLTTTATHGTKRFDMDELYALPIGLPQPYEQQSIINVFDEQQALIDRMLIQAHKLQALKTALMQDLLTGKVRVTPLLEKMEANT